MAKAHLPQELSVQGAMAPSGERWVRVTNGACVGWARLIDFTIDEKAAKLRLALAGLTMIGTQWSRLAADVAALTEFPLGPLAERPGWVASSFVMPDGAAINPKGVAPPEVLFWPDSRKCAVAGSFEEWREHVAEPLAGQSLPMFLLMMVFAAPLLQATGRTENFGFEIVGRPGCGKSTIQFLMASALGGIANDDGGKYWLTFDATLDGLEECMEAHNGLPMIINEANLFYAGDSEKARGQKLKAFAFRLGQGNEKKRKDGQKPHVSRFIFVTSSNETLGRMMGEHSAAGARAATSRLMTLNIGRDRPHGVFDRVPQEFEGAEGFAKALERAAHANHGHAIRLYLEALVELRATDPEGFRTSIDEDMARFREKADVGQDNGEVARIADAFALVYAGGQMAKRLGILPKRYSCGPAVLACFQNLYAGPKPPRSFDKLLRKVLDGPGIRHLDTAGVRRMGEKLYARTRGFTRTNRQKVKEALFKPSCLQAVMPDWEELISASDATCLLVRDDDHKAVKREVRKGRQDRVICFQLPEDWD